MPTIHLSLLDLPPPTELWVFAAAGVQLAIAKDNSLLLFDLPPHHMPQRYKGRKSRPYRIPYYGKALLVVAVSRDEYMKTQFPLTMLWSTSDQAFHQLAPNKGQTRKVLTMPRKATSAVATATKSASKADKAKASVAKAIKEEKAPPAPVHLPETHVPTQEEILGMVYERKFEPIGWDVIESACDPLYLPILKDAKKTGREATIMVRPTVEFLRAYIKANGLNRPRKPSHCLYLAEHMRGNSDTKLGYSASCTHFVLTVDRAVANGGHSSFAILATFYDARPETGNWDGVLQTKDGKDLLPWDFMPNFSWIEGDDAQDVQEQYIALAEQNGGFRVTLVLNAPRESVLKMDDIRLQASDEDYIEMLPQLVKVIEDYALPADQLKQYARGLYLRTAEPIQDEKTNAWKFGTLAKGGRLAANEAPIRAITFLPMIVEALNELRSYAKDKKHVKFNSALSGVLSLKDAVIAMAVLSPTARKRLAKEICRSVPEDGPDTFSTLLGDRLTPPANKKAAWSKPNADFIVQSLVSYGLFGKHELPTETDSPWHEPKNRADGWDKGQPNDDDVSRGEVIAKVGKEVAKLTGNADLIEAINRKAVIEERKARKAAGETGRKQRRTKAEMEALRGEEE